MASVFQIIRIQFVVIFCSILHAASAVMMVQVGQNATISCSVKDASQDGVILYKDLNNKINMCYLYKNGTFTLDDVYKDRLLTNRNLHSFSLTILSVTKQDSNAYWCLYNKNDEVTKSRTTLLFVTGVEETEDNATCSYNLYLYMISFQFFFVVILVIFLGKLVHDLRKYKSVKLPSNSEYEVMRGYQTARVLENPQYDSILCNTHVNST